MNKKAGLLLGFFIQYDIFIRYVNLINYLVSLKNIVKIIHASICENTVVNHHVVAYEFFEQSIVMGLV